MTSFAQGLSSKRVLAAGGAGGIGLACASLLSRLGAAVVIGDFNGELIESALHDSGAAGAVVLDVTNEQSCEAAVAAATTKLGGLDCLVNCAGISDVVESALTISIDAWQRVIDVNLRGSFLITRSAGRIMVPQGSGSIVNLTSIYGSCGVPRRNAYGPAKAAIEMLTRNLASEWGHAGVRVNAVAPGYVGTKMVTSLVDSGKIDLGRLENRIPLHRLGTVDEIAFAVAFLLSDSASYMTGTIIAADGGWAAYGGAGDVNTA